MAGIRSLPRWPVLIGLILLIQSGCRTQGPRGLGPTPLQQSQVPYAPEERLNIGVVFFDPGDTSEATLAAQHSNEQIRLAETRYMPFQLRNTLERSGYWGEVRVVPPGAKGLDLQVHGTILESNGEILHLQIHAVDTQGFVWLDRRYLERGRKEAYTAARTGVEDPFQHLYNSIANDLAAVRRRLDGFQVKTLRRTTEMAFAADLVPSAFADYVRRNPQGDLEVIRLPAENDPTWLRVEQISTRYELFFDALHASIEPFFHRMWPSYQEWRSYNLVEQTAIRQARQDSLRQATAGIIMIATAILLEVRDVPGSSTMRDVLVLGGAQVLINGVNISNRTEMHQETLRELADSFGAEARTVVVELEGETVTLTGSVDQQMTQWRELLQALFLAEQPPADGDLP